MTTIISSIRQLNQEIKRARRGGYKLILAYKPREKTRQKADLSAWQRIKRKAGIPNY